MEYSENLLVLIPRFCSEELTYTLDVVFKEFLGVSYETKFHTLDTVVIKSPHSTQSISINLDFFKKCQFSWLSDSSMPKLPLQVWHIDTADIKAQLMTSDVPVIFGSPGSEFSSAGYHLKTDIFGSIFFMISRYEEIIHENRDEHDRFYSKNSIAYKQNFLDRPIVNEYVEILWGYITKLWPRVSRKERKFRLLITCDVDHPFDPASSNLLATIKRCGARIIRDRELMLGLKDVLNYFCSKFDFYALDSYRSNIDWMIEKNNLAGNRVGFYFIPRQTCKVYDPKNYFRTPKVKKLLKVIHGAGHELGFHPGYNTHNNEERFRESADDIKDMLSEIGVDEGRLGGRQHYLRYDASRTPLMWSSNGFLYDSSIGYADRAGFRAGTCFEYTMYDLKNRRPLKVKQRPLIVMESSIIEYESHSYSMMSLERFRYFKKTCARFKGDFTLLWHNSHFVHQSDRDFYLELINA